MADKEKISVTLDPTQVAEISDLVGSEYESRSEAVRALIDQGLSYEEQLENLKAEYDEEIEELENENERLQRQLAATNRRVDQHQELVEYVQEERELQQRREERRDAPAWRRAKWWLLGRD